MSLDLPPRPSLDHLRKRAKELLRHIRLHHPHATLADAQHALAREYGFTSWPKLKAHVEVAAAPQPPALTFDRFTAKARQALFFSRFEAAQSGSRTIEPEHVLLGLIRAGAGLKERLFDRVSLSLDGTRAEMMPAGRAGEELPPDISIPFGDQTKRIFHAAMEEADGLRHREIRLAHILLGILRQPDSAATPVLSRRGVRLESVREDIDRLLDEEPL